MGVLDEMGIQESEVAALVRDEPTPRVRPQRGALPTPRVTFGEHVEELARLGHPRAMQVKGLLRFARSQERKRERDRRYARVTPEASRAALRADDAEIDALAEEFVYAAGSERGWGL
ncbi:MAG: hypothetical protein AB1726_10095 [Planctomycetota bacterium]